MAEVKEVAALPLQPSNKILTGRQPRLNSSSKTMIKKHQLQAYRNPVETITNKASINRNSQSSPNRRITCKSLRGALRLPKLRPNPCKPTWWTNLHCSLIRIITSRLTHQKEEGRLITVKIIKLPSQSLKSKEYIISKNCSRPSSSSNRGKSEQIFSADVRVARK